MGDYAAVAPADMLLVTHSDRHPADMAMLRGARLVTAQELAPGRAWDEPKLKSLTGGDPITARFMRQDFFTYEPQFLLAVAGNHKPSLKGVDEAIRRRLRLVPFLQNIPAEGARQGPAREAEGRVARHPAQDDRGLPGVAAGGPQPAGERDVRRPRSTSQAEDMLGQWLAERTIVSHLITGTTSNVLFNDWRKWCEENGHNPGGVPSRGGLELRVA